MDYPYLDMTNVVVVVVVDLFIPQKYTFNII